MKQCALPECKKPFTIGYGSCCKRSHHNRYAGLIRHNLIQDVQRKSYAGIKETFVGPPAPTRIKYKQEYVPTIQLSSDQQEIRRLRTRTRHKRIRHVTPIWANKENIKEIYKQAVSLTESTGIRHEVDHIIPLTNKLVCGLHNEFNLQILPMSENRSKNNKFSVE
jgi:hypothetical protein